MKRMSDQTLIKCVEWLKDIHEKPPTVMTAPKKLTEALEIIEEMCHDAFAQRALVRELPKEGATVTIKAALDYAEEHDDDDPDYDELPAGAEVRVWQYPMMDMSSAICYVGDQQIHVDTLDLIRAIRGEPKEGDGAKEVCEVNGP